MISRLGGWSLPEPSRSIRPTRLGDGIAALARISAALALVAALLTAIPSPAPAAAAGPPWILHAKRYPGGLSQGVRAYALHPTLASAGPSVSGPSSAAPSPAQGTLDNIRMTTNPVPQNETAVAFDLSDPMKAVAAANGYVNDSLWIGRTVDGGQTWSGRFKVPHVRHTGERCSASDPSVVYSTRDAAFYISTLCFTTGAISEIDVWKSVDDGAHWTSSGRAARVISNQRTNGSVNRSIFFDKELLAVDNFPASPYYGRLYATYVKFHMQPGGFSDTCPAQVAYTDHISTANPTAATWHHVGVNAPRPRSHGKGPSANQWVTPVVDSHHGLDLAYVLESCNSGADTGLFFKRSTNGGRTFGPRVKINKPGEWADDPNKGDLLPHKNARIGLSPSLAFDSQNEVLDYVFENDVNRATSGADISYARSTDFGAHWSHTVTLSVNKKGNPARKDQFFPAITSDGQGVLHAIWFDNRRDPNDVWIDTWQADSVDGGLTWTSEDISSASWDPNRSFSQCGCFIGDYNGIASSPTMTYPVWTDGRNTPGPPNGDTEIYSNPEPAP